MRLPVAILLGLTLYCPTQSAFAEDNGVSPHLSVCLDNSGGVTATMLECINVETQQQDARLNQAYRALMATLAPERQKALREAQRAWLKYRESNCTFVADPGGGSMAVVASNDCFMSATASRAKELEGFMQQQQ